MDLSIIKSEINKALSQSHAKDCTYDDLFTKILNNGGPLEFQNRIFNNTLEEFETEVQNFIKKGEDFVIYIQHDDAGFFGADCSYELEMVELNTYRFTDSNIIIYVVID